VFPVLMCRNLRRSFPGPWGSLDVLRGVDLSVEAGEVVAILGPSGSGKSTLLHLLAGLDSSPAGEIYWQDFAVHTVHPRELSVERARRIGLIFQHHYLLEELSALENVLLPGMIQGQVDRSRAEALVHEVGLDLQAQALPRTLSGGERQRVAVARSLYSRPTLLLADEPTGSLDSISARAVFDLIVALVRRHGMAVVLVTHDSGLVQGVDRRFELSAGSLIPA